ncbi:RICIN domain-containing protein [Nonomuraea sp. NPDC050790]|uniref:RICIN domain-containing protein n=1 Tax=Nonomuraea sp. NPDC050790 TaxID=3364371 RepID=UPI0037AC2173
MSTHARKSHAPSGLHRCLDADSNTLRGNGTKVQLWDCKGRSNQRWSMSGEGRLVNYANGRCLAVNTSRRGANGSKVMLWGCVLPMPATRNGIATEMRCGPRMPGKCLDAGLNTIGRLGTKVQIWDCNGQLQQQWQIIPR